MSLSRFILALVFSAGCLFGGCGESVFDPIADPNDPGTEISGPQDPLADLDKDGFTPSDGDCNDSDPLINPGAVEVAGIRCIRAADCASGICTEGYCRCTSSTDCSSGRACAGPSDCTFAGEECKEGTCTSSYLCMQAQPGIPQPQQMVCRDNRDNDCNGQTDEVFLACDAKGTLKGADARDYGRAMELCDLGLVCDASHPCPGKLTCINDRCTRLLSASFNADAGEQARAISDRFAQNGPVQARAGQSFVILSTGRASYDPTQVCPEPGTEFTNQGKDPDPSISDKVAYDYNELVLELLVPTNARSFTFDFQFFSSEYPEFLDSEFNDTFWVQLQSKTFFGNISFDKNHTPIRINNAFFDICDADGQVTTSQMCTKPASLLMGTGYAKDCNPSDFQAHGGSTGWLHTSSPVTPGERITLTFAIFDKGDHIYDSAVIIDNFRWGLAPASAPFTGTIE